MVYMKTNRITDIDGQALIEIDDSIREPLHLNRDEDGRYPPDGLLKDLMIPHLEPTDSQEADEYETLLRSIHVQRFLELHNQGALRMWGYEPNV